MEEREFFDERSEKKPATLNCPHCHQAAEYEVNWLVRTKKRQLPPRADERDLPRVVQPAHDEDWLALGGFGRGPDHLRCYSAEPGDHRGDRADPDKRAHEVTPRFAGRPRLVSG